jgi:hypothetical protein
MTPDRIADATPLSDDLVAFVSRMPIPQQWWDEDFDGLQNDDFAKPDLATQGEPTVEQKPAAVRPGRTAPLHDQAHGLVWPSHGDSTQALTDRLAAIKRVARDPASVPEYGPLRLILFERLNDLEDELIIQRTLFGDALSIITRAEIWKYWRSLFRLTLRTCDALFLPASPRFDGLIPPSHPGPDDDPSTTTEAR